jgi:hypothetical protein
MDMHPNTQAEYLATLIHWMMHRKPMGPYTPPPWAMFAADFPEVASALEDWAAREPKPTIASNK